MPPTNVDRHRLPRSVVPSHYDVTLEPDLSAGKFKGAVSIAITITQPVSEIALNAVDLEISDVRVTTAADVSITGITMSRAPELERALIALPEELSVGSYCLQMTFRGTLNNRMLGFYRSRFIDAAGRERMLAVTQMQGTNARRVLPCFDEPCFKATFKLAVIVPDGLDAVSNAPIVDHRQLDRDRRIFEFDRTIVMSPYLLAVVVGPLSSSEPVDVDGVALRTLYVGDRGHLTGFSLELAAFALRFYAKRYGLAYPGTKLDQVAVPDFAAAGMENFGCTTYREVVLLLDRARATTPELVRSADVIAHEVAHMWFGDLVTMTWWNELWLNEAFATFMGMCCIDSYKPAWNRWGQFALERSRAFDVDSLETTRPLEYPVESPLQALGMLDLLTYRKGASLLRMLEQFVGSDRFFEGVRRYLGAHAYGNATGDDLWAAIESATQQPVAHMMKSWIFQEGYPIVAVSLARDRKRLTVTQSRFRFAGLGADRDTRFIIPLQFRSLGADGSTRDHRLILEERAASIDFPEPIDGIVMNAGGYGFYRVRYETSMLRSLLSPEHGSQTSPEERYLLVDDCWATVLEGTTTALEFLQVVEGMTEVGLRGWTLVASAFESIGRILDAESSAHYQARLGEHVSAALRALGWETSETESSESRELRGVLVRLLGTTCGAADIVEWSRALHQRYLSDPSAIEPNLAAAVATVVARNGSDEDYEIFAGRCAAAATPQEALRYQRALGEFPAKRHMERTLAMCMGGAIRSQDAPLILAVALSNREQGITAWRFVKSNWEHINRTYSPIAIAPCLASVSFLDQPEVADDVVSFFRAHEVPQGRQMLQHLERLRVNVAFRQRERPRLAGALRM